MASQLLGIKTRFTNDLGSPLVGGQVYTYFAGTSTNQDSYSDAALTVPNTNPVILDDTGSADIFLKGSYRIRVFDKSGRFIEEQDNVTQVASQGDATEINERIDSIQSDVELQKLDTGITATAKFGGVERSQADKNSDVIHAKDFGLVGDGTDETEKLFAMFAAASGKTIHLGKRKTYGYRATLTIPEFVTLVSHSSGFKRLSASESWGVEIHSGFTADKFIYNSTGGAKDYGVRLLGSDITIGYLESVADSTGLIDGANPTYGLCINRIGNLIKLSNITIHKVKTRNWRTHIPIYNCDSVVINNIKIEGYITGVYLMGVSNFTGNNGYALTTHLFATGSAGQNGVLIESVKGTDNLVRSSTNIHLNDWRVVNAPEHSYRIGGFYRVSNVWHKNCRSALSGNATGNISTGGCGFKCLGNPQENAFDYHKNIFYEGCLVEDCNTEAAGQGNFAGYSITNTESFNIINCRLGTRSNNYSAHKGIYLDSVRDGTISNSYILGVKQHGLICNAKVYSTQPYLLGVIENVSITNTTFEVKEMLGGGYESPVIYFEPLSAGGESLGAVENFRLSNVTLVGGNQAVRTDSYTNKNNRLDFEWRKSRAETVAVSSGSPWLINISADTDLVSSPEGINGSTYVYALGEKKYIKSNNRWTVEPTQRTFFYSPVYTDFSGVDAVTSTPIYYTHIGNIVTVMGQINITPSASGQVAFKMSLPVVSSFDNSGNAAGFIMSDDNSITGIVQSLSSKVLEIRAKASTTSSKRVTIHATYWVK